MFAGEHLPGPAEAGRDLIGDHQDIVLGAEFPDLFQISRRLHEHACRALDQGLDDEGRGLMAIFLDHPLGLFRQNSPQSG